MLKKLFLFGWIILLTTKIVFAQVDSNPFNIKVFGGTDLESPTTPVLISTTPIATSQIDVVWSVSTDNFLLSGYVVERDGVPIATTTLQSFSDTGLSASTSYNYSVRAFDPSFNYSSSSNILSTTTLEIVIPPEISTSTDSSVLQGTVSKVVLRNLLITEGISTTSLQFNTAMPARIEVRWGKTAAYELGYVINETYSKDHFILLSELEPGTKYNYEIIGYTPYGKQTLLKSDWFKTLEKNASHSPMNVSKFEAVTELSDVKLSWKITEFDNFSYVRIVRSHIGFPEYPQNGAVVYQGTESGFTDKDILNTYSPVYYTAFVYDVFGNVSSGAIAIAYANDDLNKEIELEKNNFNSNDTDRLNLIVPVIVDEATSTINKERLKIDMKMPHASEIIIKQGDLEYSLMDNDINIVSNESFVIYIPRQAISGNLKSIIVTIIDPTDMRKAYSYLLRINKEQTAYETVIPPFLVIGNSQIKVSIYDYEAFVVGNYQAPVSFIEEELTNEVVVFPDKIYKNAKVIFVLPIIIILSALLFFFYKKRTEDNL